MDSVWTGGSIRTSGMDHRSGQAQEFTDDSGGSHCFCAPAGPLERSDVARGERGAFDLLPTLESYQYSYRHTMELMEVWSMCQAHSVDDKGKHTAPCAASTGVSMENGGGGLQGLAEKKGSTQDKNNFKSCEVGPLSHSVGGAREGGRWPGLDSKKLGGSGTGARVAKRGLKEGFAELAGQMRHWVGWYAISLGGGMR